MAKINKKVIIQSIAALGCIGLMYFVSWLFIVPAAILLFLNQKELIK